MAAERLGSTRCRARQASIFSTSCGSTRMSIFAVFPLMVRVNSSRAFQKLLFSRRPPLAVSAEPLLVRLVDGPERLGTRPRRGPAPALSPLDAPPLAVPRRGERPLAELLPVVWLLLVASRLRGDPPLHERFGVAVPGKAGRVQPAGAAAHKPAADAAAHKPAADAAARKPAVAPPLPLRPAAAQQCRRLSPRRDQGQDRSRHHFRHQPGLER